MTSSWFAEDQIFEIIAEEQQSQKESEEIEFDDFSAVDYDLDYTVQD